MFQKLAKWANSNSIWYLPLTTGCCGDEIFQTSGCRYDLERLGCFETGEPSHADLLIVNGATTHKLAAELQRVYDQMVGPKFVMALGACACSGGFFDKNPLVVQGTNQLVPVDVYVPGCPPRPEAIMNGILALQEKILAN